MSLITADPSPNRLMVVGFGMNSNIPTLLSMLVRFISLDISNFGKQVEINKIMVNMKMYALKCLTRFISVCSIEANLESDSHNADFKRLSKVCAETFIQEEGFSTLFECLIAPEEHSESEERMRLIISECLFFFICKNEIARLAVIFQQGHVVMMELMSLEPSPFVRSYYSALIRELSITFPEDLIKEHCLNHCTAMLSNDIAEDVRALSAETMDILIKADSSVLKNIPSSEICKVLFTKLNSETSTEVLQTCCTLMETIFGFDEKMRFHKEFLKNHYWTCFIRIVKSCSIKLAVKALKCFRLFIQATDRKSFSQVLVQKFEIVQQIMKTLLDYSELEIKTEETPKKTVSRKKLIETPKQKPTPNTKRKADKTTTSLFKLELTMVFIILISQSTVIHKRVIEELATNTSIVDNLIQTLSHNGNLVEDISYISDLVITDEEGHILTGEEQESDSEDEDFHSNKLLGKKKLDILNQIISQINETFEVVKKKQPQKKTPRITPRKTPVIQRTGDRAPVTTPPSTPSHIAYDSSEDEPEYETTTVPAVLPITILHPQDGEDFRPGYFGAPTNNIPVGDLPDRGTSVGLKRPGAPQTYEEIELHKQLTLCRVFSLWYESKEMRYQKEEQQDRFITTFQLAKLGKHSPAFVPVNSPKEPRSNKGTHLYHQKLPYHYKHSPQKLTRIWSDEDVKPLDLFLFEIPIDDVNEKNLNFVIEKLKKHQKGIAKDFVVAPQGNNARGRKVFLLDLKQNILPKIEMAFLQLLLLGKETSFNNVKINFNMWKRVNVRSDVGINHENLLEIIEFMNIQKAAVELEKKRESEASRTSGNVSLTSEPTPHPDEIATEAELNNESIGTESIELQSDESKTNELEQQSEIKPSEQSIVDQQDVMTMNNDTLGTESIMPQIEETKTNELDQQSETEAKQEPLIEDTSVAQCLEYQPQSLPESKETPKETTLLETSGDSVTENQPEENAFPAKEEDDHAVIDAKVPTD